MPDSVNETLVSSPRSHARWTEDEVALLKSEAPYLTRRRIRQHFPRHPHASVTRKLADLGLTGRRNSHCGLCYTVPEAAAAMGISYNLCMDWVRRGWLRAETFEGVWGAGGASHHRYRISHAHVDEFVATYPFMFSLATFPRNEHYGTLLMARPQEWMKVRAAAQRLELSTGYVQTLVKRGVLPGRELGERHRFVLCSDVERLRRERTRNRQLCRMA